MQEHMNVEDCQAAGSTPFMLMVSIPYTPVVHHFSIIFVTTHPLYNPLLAYLHCITLKKYLFVPDVVPWHRDRYTLKIF